MKRGTAWVKNSKWLTHQEKKLRPFVVLLTKVKLILDSFVLALLPSTDHSHFHLHHAFSYFAWGTTVLPAMIYTIRFEKKYYIVYVIYVIYVFHNGRYRKFSHTLVDYCCGQGVKIATYKEKEQSLLFNREQTWKLKQFKNTKKTSEGCWSRILTIYFRFYMSNFLSFKMQRFFICEENTHVTTCL